VSLSTQNREIVYPADLTLEIIDLHVKVASDLNFMRVPKMRGVLLQTHPRTHPFPPKSCVDIGPDMSNAGIWKGVGGSRSLVVFFFMF
jgi:hypothetical protein